MSQIWPCLAPWCLWVSHSASVGELCIRVVVLVVPPSEARSTPHGQVGDVPNAELGEEVVSIPHLDLLRGARHSSKFLSQLGASPDRMWFPLCVCMPACMCARVRVCLLPAFHWPQDSCPPKTTQGGQDFLSDLPNMPCSGTWPNMGVPGRTTVSVHGMHLSYGWE